MRYILAHNIFVLQVFFGFVFFLEFTTSLNTLDRWRWYFIGSGKSWPPLSFDIQCESKPSHHGYTEWVQSFIQRPHHNNWSNFSKPSRTPSSGMWCHMADEGVLTVSEMLLQLLCCDLWIKLWTNSGFSWCAGDNIFALNVFGFQAVVGAALIYIHTHSAGTCVLGIMYFYLLAGPEVCVRSAWICRSTGSL